MVSRTRGKTYRAPNKAQEKIWGRSWTAPRKQPVVGPSKETLRQQAEEALRQWKTRITAHLTETKGDDDDENQKEKSTKNTYC